MAKYSVYMSQTVRKSTEVEVEADSEDEALDKAFDIDDDSLSWYEKNIDSDSWATLIKETAVCQNTTK